MTGEPRAFTRTEFLRGVGRAWLWTTLLLVLAWAAVTEGAGVFAIVVILPASLVALVIGAPGAYVLGRRLRSSSRTGVHLVAFAGYGALLASLMTMLVVLIIARDSSAVFLARIMLLVNAPAGAVGVAGAWLFTVREALRSDRAASEPSRACAADPDAAVEDALDDGYRVIDPGQRPRA